MPPTDPASLCRSKNNSAYFGIGNGGGGGDGGVGIPPRADAMLAVDVSLTRPLR